MPRPDPLQMLTIEEVAEILKVSTRTIERMIGAGELVQSKWDRVRRIRRSDLERFIKARSKRAEPKPPKPPAPRKEPTYKPLWTQADWEMPPDAGMPAE